MMHEMMRRCCAAEGKPDLEKMKAFMQSCGKQGFGEGEIAMMKQFCGEAGMLDAEKLKQMTEQWR